ITSTTASKRLIVNAGNRLLPKYDPTAPPISAATAKGMAIAGNDLLAVQFPSSPAMELTKMNMAEMADAVFVGAQWRKITSGVRKIPPPVPVSPDRSPKAPPMTTASGFGGAFVWPSAGG